MSVGLSATNAVGASPEPENRAPTVLVLLGSIVAENIFAGMSVGNLVALDPDADMSTFELLDDAGGRFELDGDTLVVKDGSLIDFEAARFHDVKVRATDPFGAFIEKTFRIFVVDREEQDEPAENYAPTDLQLGGGTIEENASDGAFVGSVIGIDLDHGDSLAYTLLDDAQGRFALSNGNIVVKDGSRLDYESANSYDIKVRATDTHGAFIERTFTIQLKDLPDTRPPENHAPEEVYLSGDMVGENAEKGTVVGSLGAFDPDPNESFTYTLVNDAEGRFAIQDGRLVVQDRTLLDYETASSHIIWIRVSDSHGLSHERSFRIWLKDEAEGEVPGNRAPNDVILGRTAISENPDDSFLVSALLAVDPDSSERFSYSLINDADGRFAIHGSKLIVADSGRIDYEAATFHTIRICVEDSYGASFEKDVTIHVKDVLDTNIVLTGSAGNDKLLGGSANDKLTGGAGNDILSGGEGKDILTGKSGKDAFVFDAAGKKNVDRITDFSVQDDTINLAKSFFAEIGSNAKLSTKAFWIGSKAHDANDRIIYNSKTGALSYDSDGAGGKAAVQIATLKKGLTDLSHKDFLLI